MRWFVDGIYLLAAVLLMPVVLYRSLTTGKYRQDWGQRRGYLPGLPPHPRRIWVHAVSVGEVNAVRGLIEAWRRRRPDTEIVLSTTTDTGIARARQIFPGLTVVRYPLDFSRFVDRALDRIRPTMIVLVELEVWYQFATRAAARGIPVTVVNGRLSERSLRRFARVRSFAGRMFGSLAWVGAQDEDYARRFREVGVAADRVCVTGSMKWDTAEITDTIAGSQTLAAAMGIDRHNPLWVCGSTGPGEEAVILQAYQRLRADHPGLQLVLVPRKPERFDEVADLIRQRGLECVRRTARPDEQNLSQKPASRPNREPFSRRPQVGASAPLAKESVPAEEAPTCGRWLSDRPAGSRSHTVFLGDTMGELRKFYALADVVFVGRSLAAMGGSDAMEVAALARPVVVGPHNENFADVVRRFREAEAIRMVEADLDVPAASDRLAEAVGGLLNDRPAAARMAQAARIVVQENRGAIERTLIALMEIMDRAQHRPS